MRARTSTLSLFGQALAVSFYTFSLIFFCAAFETLRVYVVVAVAISLFCRILCFSQLLRILFFEQGLKVEKFLLATGMARSQGDTFKTFNTCRIRYKYSKGSLA